MYKTNKRCIKQLLFRFGGLGMANRISNNLLLEDRSIAFLPELACLVGDREAIFLQQIHYFNKDKGIDNDWFTRSLEELHTKYFSFWSLSTLRRIKDKMIARQFLEVRKLRSNHADHTLSYRINKKNLFQALLEKQSKQNKLLMTSPSSSPSVDDGGSPEILLTPLSKLSKTKPAELSQEGRPGTPSTSKTGDEVGLSSSVPPLPLNLNLIETGEGLFD